jgi:predicted MFS family arabinose efflux permease
VLFIGVLCFILFLTESAVLDWSAVFLTSVRRVDASYAGPGYAAFALTMTIGRLSGDRVVQRVGSTNIIAFGGICAATGFALVTLTPFWPMALLGFALVGVGCSNVVPVLFTSVGRQTAMPESLAVPAITSLGYAGILLGPAAIGAVARAASLSVAFLIVALMLVGVVACGRLLRT